MRSWNHRDVEAGPAWYWAPHNWAIASNMMTLQNLWQAALGCQWCHRSPISTPKWTDSCTSSGLEDWQNCHRTIIYIWCIQYNMTVHNPAISQYVLVFTCNLRSSCWLKNYGKKSPGFPQHPFPGTQPPKWPQSAWPKVPWPKRSRISYAWPSGFTILSPTWSRYEGGDADA